MYYILIRVSGAGLQSHYKYLTTIEQGGSEGRMSFATKGLAQNQVKSMIDSGEYSMNDIIVVRGCTITTTLVVDDDGY